MNLSFLSLKKNMGFSLLELLISIAIIVILGSIGIPSYMRQRTKALRGDCQTMLTTLDLAMKFYISENTMSYNQIHCPKTYTDGLQTRTVSGEEKSVLTIAVTEKDNYCDGLANAGPANMELGVSTTKYDGTIRNKTAYQYLIRACPATQLTCATGAGDAISDGSVFPSFSGGGLNVHGFNHPADDTTTNATSLITPVHLYEYIIQCHGNIDHDATTDTLNMDHTGRVIINSDDVKN